MKNEEKSLKYLLYNKIISRFFYRDGLLIPKTRNVIFKQVIKVCYHTYSVSILLREILLWKENFFFRLSLIFVMNPVT